MPDMPHITAAELNVLKVVWRLKSATVRDVLDQLASQSDTPPAYTTVMTLMNQLAGKDALNVDKSRQPYVYEPAIRRDQVLGQRLTQFLQTVFDGQAGELVMRLVEQEKLSGEELRRIEEFIDERDTSNEEDRT